MMIEKLFLVENTINAKWNAFSMQNDKAMTKIRNIQHAT